MLRVTFYLLCFFAVSTYFSVSLLAQQPKQAALDAAEKQLNAVFNHLKELESIDASFSLEIFDAHNKSVAKQLGRVRLKENKYELNIGEQHIYSNGATLWIYNKLFNEVQINDYTKEENNIFDVENLLSGELQYKQFTSKYNGQAMVKEKQCNEIEMTPRDKSKPFFKVLLWVEPSSNNIEKAHIFSKTGTKYVYTTEKLKKNVVLAANFGTFDVENHSDVDVVDLR